MHATGYICNKNCQVIKLAGLAIGCYQVGIEWHREEVIYQSPEVREQEDPAEDEPQSWSKVGAGAMEGKKPGVKAILDRKKKKKKEILV